MGRALSGHWPIVLRTVKELIKHPPEPQNGSRLNRPKAQKYAMVG